MNELILTEDETALVNMYRAMNIECRNVALAMCQAMALNGKFFSPLKVISNNQVGDNNYIQIGVTTQTEKYRSDDNGI